MIGIDEFTMNSPHHGDRGIEGGGKRPMEVDGGCNGVGKVKRRKKEVVNRGEEEMKRVAELVLVLSAMGMMRGGREPTVIETTMMDEARKKVVSLCEEISPKDIVPREGFVGLIDDLGLNRLKDQRLGFRPPKLSISDKIALTKRRMEESNAFASESAPHPPQRLQTGNEAASENRGTPPSVRGPSPDTIGTFQSPTNVTHTPIVVQTPQPHAGHVSTPSAYMTRNAAKDTNSMAPSRFDRAHMRHDGRPNGPSAVPQAPVTSPADRHTVRMAPAPAHTHLQPQPPSRFNIGAKKAPDQMPLRAGNTGGPQMIAQGAQPTVVQTPKPAVSETAPGTIPTLHHPVQGQYAHSAAINPHVGICKVVQRLLSPSLSQVPTWTSPLKDYMNKAHPCQFCKLIINEVETVVICDACEKAFHLGCLQSHNVKGIPRGEWHCPRCVAMSHGKPFPPKYGRVTRNMNAAKGPSNTSVGHFASEKKVESVNEKVSQLNATTHTTANVRAQSQTVSPSNLPNHLHGGDTGRTYTPVGLKKEVRPNIGSGPENRNGAAMHTSQLTSTGSSSDEPPQRAMKSEVSHSEDGFIAEIKSSTSVIPQANGATQNLPSFSNQNNLDLKASNKAESPLFQHGSSSGVVEHNTSFSEERCEKGWAKQEMVVRDRTQDHTREAVETSKTELHNVDWVGEIYKVIDDKKYFLSCRINGVVYHVQNYALFHSSTGKVTPLRLQGMWEDGQTSSKWLLVHKCYFPDDLPSEVGRPGAPQINEVYESTHDSSVLAGSVQGPCEVLPFRKFGEEAHINDSGSQGNERVGPVFVRNWFYDESKRAFCPSAS